MMLDHLARSARYRPLSPGLAAALDFLQRTDLDALTSGPQSIDGERLIAHVNRYRTKPAAEAVWEAHQQYIDVQFLVRGQERFGVLLSDAAPAVTTTYDAARDVTFFAPDAAQEGMALWGTLSAGQFAIFFPEDIHAPGLECQAAADVFKVVMKVRIDW